MTINSIKYIIVSAVKDEERYIESTLISVTQQSMKPSLWIIVDDGSRDKTHEIVSRYTKSYDWIKLIKIEKHNEREPGGGVIRAFNVGYNTIKNMDFDLIVKLDCDLKFGTHYFENIINEFTKAPKLGIASGVYREYDKNKWNVIRMPEYHAAGASKVIRKECFQEIGGFIPLRGWDTIDEIRAQMKEWKTGHFTNIEFYHLKNEGSGIGLLKTNAMQGEIYYMTGGNPLFFILKAVHRLFFVKPFLLAGAFQIKGYLNGVMKQEKIVTREEERFYRNLLFNRIKKRLSDW